MKSIIVGLTLVFVALAASGARAHEDISIGPAPTPYVSSLVGAVNNFIKLLSPEQQTQGIMPFDSPHRVLGRDTENTPAFCATLAWCEPWGLKQCDLTYEQRVAMNNVLAVALSGLGYQSLLATVNRQRIIGELEDVGDGAVVGEIAKRCNLSLRSIYDTPPTCYNGTPLDQRYVVVGGDGKPDAKGNYDVTWSWPGGAPKTKVRHEQFCDYSLAIFGVVGGPKWALRFEGHHTTINITAEQTQGGVVVHQSPLFLGAFPIVAPPAPDASDLSKQMAWVNGQQFMSATVDDVRALIENMPGPVAVGVDDFNQVSPLLQDVVPPYLDNSLAIAPTKASQSYPLTTVPVASLSDDAIWRLTMLYRRFFDAMHPAVGDQYTRNLEALLSPEQFIFVTVGGEKATGSGENVYLRVVVGDYLIELVADNQWSTQHIQAPTANHLHAMFRDLSFQWDYDPSRAVEPHHHAPDGTHKTESK
ncbi:MAG: DUF3500 domain-containing protein [Pikeienuella sp.]